MCNLKNCNANHGGHSEHSENKGLNLSHRITRRVI
jgi:hypothetical protein